MAEDYYDSSQWLQLLRVITCLHYYLFTNLTPKRHGGFFHITNYKWEISDFVSDD